MSDLAASYRHCEEIARSRAKNFYPSFRLLPKRKRLAMCAVYAFMRRCDDLSDEQGASIEALEEWRRHLDLALDGGAPPDPLWPAFHDTVTRFGIPRKYFHEMVDGVESDLTPRRIVTFDDLYRYCYHVASVVGLTIIHIFGFSGPRALEYAEHCGIAFQLTNILRDIREDAANGRVYLPEEDLRRFAVPASDLAGPYATVPVREIVRHHAGVARDYYQRSRPLLQLVEKDSSYALWALMEVYQRLLHRIELSGYDTLSRRISVPSAEKARILLRAFTGFIG
jgi:phytoene synthase